MGLGRFGGGVGVTRWLAAQGAKVLVTDLALARKLERSLGEISDLIESGAVELCLEEHREEDFTRTDVVIANPAVPKPWENRFLKAATVAGVPITTEIRLLVERLPNRDRTIGVTGTAGKSTTAAMIAHILSAEGERAQLGGNIGGSLLAELGSIQADEWVVLELSSAQLYWLGERIGFEGAPGWSPGNAVVTNVAPNHLDWHGTLEHYEDSKKNVLRYGVRRAVLESSLLDRWIDEPRDDSPDSDTIWLSANREDADRIGGLIIPGDHNKLNAALAHEMTKELAPRAHGWAEHLRSFPGLHHRLEFVGEFGGARAFNDSKCTTPEATALAINAFEEPHECGANHLQLICGGYDKKIDLAPMVDAAACCKGVYTIGSTGPAIARAVLGKGGNAIECGGLRVAVERAAAGASPGDVILLSPGCASWDQFENYEERGEAFKAGVREAL